MVWVMGKESRQAIEESEDGYMDDSWTPRMVLGHEFSLLPFIYPHGYPRHLDMHGSVEEAVESAVAAGDDRLLLSMGCPNIQDMQVSSLQKASIHSHSLFY